MATGGDTATLPHSPKWASHHQSNYFEQSDEVLALESIYEDGEVGLNVLSRPNTDADNDPVDGLFSVQLTIPIDTAGETITVDICMPANELEKDGDFSTFRRSDSGMRIIGSVTVQYLYPISLTIVLPHEYPSSAPPKFTMSCPWLTSVQMTSLCEMMDRLWAESLYMPVLFTWITWLQENVKDHIGLRDRIFLQDDIEEGDSRVISEQLQIDHAVISMMRYDQQREEYEFTQREQECRICFTQQPGSSFHRLRPCKHHFCRECVGEYCRTHIVDGNVLNLNCPETDCKSEIPPPVVSLNLTPEELERYETLSLRKGLDCMGDVVWCPRCQNPVIVESVEKESRQGHCLTCVFTFCTQCQEPWHQGRCYSDIMEELGNNIRRQEQQAQLQKKLDKEARKREEMLSRKVIEETSRPCPSCKMDISKMSGCNKVTCGYCQRSMCWACGVDITMESYGHFDKCALSEMDPFIANDFYKDGRIENDFYGDGGNVTVPRFRRQIIQRNPKLEEIDLTLATTPEEKKNLIRCPFCKQRNLRKNQDNHVRCWNCSRSGCFQCKRGIAENPVLKHFLPPNLCKQHAK
ncbi:E3 ubiquitin-protein ligase RNF14-like [Crassostrea virginica]|uniref:RBR-type E3 ubiquitin transferase n=1 Tax=Crassostrea virginica TaxID=6565 RepID=A0A8B8CUC6_CRAVI|nr:E3 ubiquitin-protein ligase RNF14-like [Crassostrea virginica]